MNISNIDFIQGDVGNLPFEDEMWYLSTAFMPFPTRKKHTVKLIVY